MFSISSRFLRMKLSKSISCSPLVWHIFSRHRQMFARNAEFQFPSFVCYRQTIPAVRGFYSSAQCIWDSLWRTCCSIDNSVGGLSYVAVSYWPRARRLFHLQMLTHRTRIRFFVHNVYAQLSWADVGCACPRVFSSKLFTFLNSLAI